MRKTVFLTAVFLCSAFVFTLSAADIKGIYQKARGGDIQSMFDLAECYATGSGVTKKIPNALLWYEKASAKDHAKASLRLANYHLTGSFENPDLTPLATLPAEIFPAVTYYDRDTEANMRLFREKLINDKNTENQAENFRKAIDFYRKAAKDGDADAKYIFGIFCFHGMTNDSLNAEYFLPAAEAGNPFAQYFLGICYASAKGCEKDIQKAQDWLLKSVGNNFVHAQYYFGKCYNFGKFFMRYYEKAIEYFTMAAKQGHPDALFILGRLHALGLGTKKNPEEAAKLFREAANRNHPDAQYALALCLTEGFGVEKNPAEAANFFKMAADNGVINAMYRYAMCCRNSIGIAENPEEAAKYFLFAAAYNYCDAIYRFGVCKIKGYGTQLDQELGAAFIFDASRKILEEPDTLYWTLTHPKGNAKLSGRLHLEAIKNFANWYLFGHIDQTDPVTFRQYLADMQKNYHQDAVNRFENGTLRPDPDCDFISYEEKFANAASSTIKSYIKKVVTYNDNKYNDNKYNYHKYNYNNYDDNKYNGNNLTARHIRYAPYFLTYAALRGVAEFQYMLSVFYTDGFGIELVPAFAPAGLNFWKDIMWKTDSHFAHYFLTEAAKNGMPVAQYELALQFIKEKNKDQAVEMLKKAAAKDFAPAKLRLAQQTDDEAVLEEFFNSDPQNALKIAGFYELDGNADARLKWLLKGAEQNVLQAIYQLGKDCIARKKPDEAQIHFDNAAAQSHAMALEIGKYYLLELKKTEEAKAFLEKAALSDDKELIFNIAACYSKYPAIRDVVKEVELLTRASDLLHPAAQFELAKIYLFGKGDITASTEQGIKLLQDSADNGFPAAQNLYAKFLAEGDFGLKINLIVAVEYLKKAVEQNNGDACFTLAQCLFTGNWKFDKDEEKALRMLYRGANNGGKEAARQFANYITVRIKIFTHLNRFCANVWLSTENTTMTS